MTVQVVDRSRSFLMAYREASRKAVDAAANAYEVNVKRRFYQGYYTSQAFRSTAQIVQHIQREPPVWTAGGWHSLVGIPMGIPVKVAKLGAKRPFSVGEIALAWELGHHNIFSRRYERVEIFKPVALNSLDQIAKTYSRVLTRFLNQGVSGGAS